MNYYQIPFQATFPNDQKIDVQCQVFYSDDIYNRYKDHGSGDLWSESGLNSTDAAIRVNQFFGDNILNKNVRLYTVRQPDDDADHPGTTEKEFWSYTKIEPDVLSVGYDFNGEQPYSGTNTFRNGIVSPTNRVYGMYTYLLYSDPRQFIRMSYYNDVTQYGHVNIYAGTAEYVICVFHSNLWNDDGSEI